MKFSSITAYKGGDIYRDQNNLQSVQPSLRLQVLSQNLSAPYRKTSKAKVQCQEKKVIIACVDFKASNVQYFTIHYKMKNTIAQSVSEEFAVFFPLTVVNY